MQLEDVLDMLNESDAEVKTLQSGVANFENGLMTMKSSLDSDMTFPNCGLNTHCRRMQILTEQLDIAGDFSDVSDPLQRSLARFFRDIYRQFRLKVSFFVVNLKQSVLGQ